MIEELTKASQSMSLAVVDLQCALNKSNAVEGLSVLDILKLASELDTKIHALLVAVKEDKRWS